MPRECTICAHPAAPAIDKAIVAGIANRRIATQHGLSEAAVRRHSKEHLPLVIQAGAHATQPAPNRRAEPTHAPALAAQVQHREQAAERHAIDVRAELEWSLACVRKLLQACDEWLTDPEDPSRYDIGPRSTEIAVQYSVPDPEGRPQRKRATLDELLHIVEGGGMAVDRSEFKHADPRKLVLDAVGQLQAQLEFVVALMERLHAQQEIERFIELVLEAIGEFDSATRDRIVAALQRNYRLAAPAGAAGGA